MTAEFAAVLPAVVLVLVFAIGALQAAALQIRVVDAAAVAARSLGRSEPDGVARSRIGTLLPSYTLDSEADGDFVCATVTAPVTVAGAAVGDLRVSGRSCALGGGK